MSKDSRKITDWFDSELQRAKDEFSQLNRHATPQRIDSSTPKRETNTERANTAPSKLRTTPDHKTEPVAREQKTPPQSSPNIAAQSKQNSVLHTRAP